jgi:hypothetical protein
LTIQQIENLSFGYHLIFTVLTSSEAPPRDGQGAELAPLWFGPSGRSPSVVSGNEACIYKKASLIQNRVQTTLRWYYSFAINTMLSEVLKEPSDDFAND